MHYDPVIVASGKANLEALRDDTRPVFSYGDTHLADVGSREGGLFYRPIIGAHSDVVAQFETLLNGTKTLLGNAAGNIQETMDAYATNEQRNLDAIAKQIWSALEMSEGLDPVGRHPDGTAKVGELPSTVLTEPSTDVGHWILNVLAWPDYLSISSWARKILGFLWEKVTGKDPWDWLWEWLGGDWEQIGLVASAWDNLSDYFKELPEELTARMQVMFEGWYASGAATAAGEYLAEAAKVLGGVADPLGDLATQYSNVAWASYGLCQAVYSLLDAVIDTVIAMLAGGLTFAEALAAPFTGGATAATGAVTGIVAIVQAVSAAWGYMMLAVNLILGLGATLGAYTTQIDWVTLPEG